MSIIVKSFGDKTPQQVEAIGLTATISWHKLSENLGSLIGKTPGEKIEGIVVDETGLSVKLSTIPPTVK